MSSFDLVVETRSRREGALARLRDRVCRVEIDRVRSTVYTVRLHPVRLERTHSKTRKVRTMARCGNDGDGNSDDNDDVDFDVDVDYDNGVWQIATRVKSSLEFIFIGFIYFCSACRSPRVFLGGTGR